MIHMSPREIELARHALGLPNKARMSYRNRFVAGVGHEDYATWVQMVADGNAKVRYGASLPYGGDSLFWLTREGAEQALLKVEHLDPEDFNGPQALHLSDKNPAAVQLGKLRAAKGDMPAVARLGGLAAARKGVGGRKGTPTHCARCGSPCASQRAAKSHCR